MIRGGAVTLGAVAGGAFVPGAVAQAATPTQTFARAESVDGAFVAPFGRHLAYGNDPRTEMTVSWQVPVAVKKLFIRIGAHPWDLSRKIEAEVRALYTPAGVGASGDHTQYYVHAKLSRLRPGRTYSYGVGHQGFDPAEPHLTGTLGTFTTTPWPTTACSSARTRPSICTPATSPTPTRPARARPPTRSSTRAPGTSSSPNGYGGEEARFTLPDNGPDKAHLPGVYSFVHGNTAVISLDPNDVSFEIPAPSASPAAPGPRGSRGS